MRRKLIVGLALVALLLGGCSKNTSSDSAPMSGNGGVAAPEKAPQDARADADKQQATDGTATTTGSVDNRSLIYRGDITVRVEDVEKAADQIKAMATTLGGHVDSEKRVAGTVNASASITIRVPSKEFETAFSRAAALGKEQSRSSNVEDVTEAVVDLDSRIASQKAALDATRALYSKTVTFADISSLNKEIKQMEADLAALEAKKRRIDDLIALSTVTVTLLGPNTDIPVEKANPGFLDGLKAGWDAFKTSVRVLLVVSGWLLPFIALFAILLIALVWVSRRRRRVRQGGQAST